MSLVGLVRFNNRLTGCHLLLCTVISLLLSVYIWCICTLLASPPWRPSAQHQWRLLSREQTFRSLSDVFIHLNNSFVTKSSLCFLKRQLPSFYDHTEPEIYLFFLHLHEKSSSRPKTMDYGGTLNKLNQGFTGSGVDLTSSFLKILYIFFCAIHFLMFLFLIYFSFFKFFCTALSTVKQNEGHSQRSNCRKHHNHVLSSYHYWRCMWLWVCVSERLCVYIKV